jgi:ribonuclease VapC
MVVDTSGLGGHLAAGAGCPDLRRCDRRADQAVISAASYVELTIVALSRGTRGRAEVEAALADALIETVPMSVDQAHIAADAYARYGRERHPAGLNFSDCFAYALAMSRSEALLFKGRISR